MTKYNLISLGHQRFEELSQSLVQNVIGPGVKVYGMGSDGGREATYEGRANYPSTRETWDGKWIFQSKFHDTLQIGQKEARKLLFSELDSELDKIINVYKIQCDNYILITNVPLTPVFQKGLKDRIDNVLIPKYQDRIKNIHVWGAEEVCGFLDSYIELRQSYLQFLVSGDIIARLLGLLNNVDQENDSLDELVQLYCQKGLTEDQAAALDDAGDEDSTVPLQNVFFDIDVIPETLSHERLISDSIPKWLKQASTDEDRNSALSFLFDDSVERMVFVGGPGQGKSTVGQFVSQVHRARLTGRLAEFSIDGVALDDCTPRIPFRILLKDLAHWFNLNEENTNLFSYISYDMSSSTGKKVTTDNVHQILKNNPILLVLDGLDEVPEKNVRSKMINAIITFIGQIKSVYNSNLKVLASTRPQGYSEEFNPDHYLHLKLDKLSKNKAQQYAKKWVENREGVQLGKRGGKIIEVLTSCLEDDVVADLTKTPLQITILLVIIRAGATPPKQREELYQKYMDTIYNREQNKNANLVPTDKNLIYGIHKFIAYKLHYLATQSNSNALMDTSEFRDSVIDYLYYDNPYITDEELVKKVGNILTEVQDRLVLLESPQLGKIGFSLTVMREFFTACHLVDSAKDTLERLDRFKAISRSAHWRNVVLFFVGRIGRNLPGEASGIITICNQIDSEDEDKILKRGSQLLLDILNDRAFREPFQEISALQNAIKILDYHKVISPNEIHIKIKTLPEHYAEKGIKEFFHHRFKNIISTELNGYISTYEKVFGYDVYLEEALSRLVTLQDRKDAALLFNIGVKYEILEQWVIDACENIPERDLFEESIHINDYGIQLLRILSKETLKIKDNIILILMNLLELSIDHEDEDEEENEFIEYTSEIVEQYKEKKWTIMIAILFTHKIMSDTKGREKRYPLVANPRVREAIITNKERIEEFISTHENSDKELKIIVEVLKFLMNPKSYKSAVPYLKELIQNTRSSFIYNFSNNLLTHDHDDIVSLYFSFEDYNEYIEYFRGLDKIIEKKSYKVDGIYKIGSWIQAGFPAFQKPYLDESILNDLHEWTSKKSISLKILPPLMKVSLPEEYDGESVSLFNEIVQYFLNEKKIYFSLASLLNRMLLVDPEKEKVNILKNEITKLLQIENTDGFSGFTTSILIGALNREELLTQEHLVLYFKHLKKDNVDGRRKRLLPHIIGYGRSLENLVESDNEIARALSSYILASLRTRNFSKEILGKILFESIQNSEMDIIKDNCINALCSTSLDWENISQVIRSYIRESVGSEQQRKWIDVLCSAEFNETNKIYLKELIVELIEDGYEYRNLYERLTELVDLAYFEEVNLSLPLPKRKFSDIW
ncbi:NACHT domain-containing NTPase [Paenibacillus sp. LK1]|uniref:NACHT domain-containing protein n=1 Tax=Paenibacillus sp. LK1 TaxID=2053014 RepID=UPI000C1A2568|nr:hypothetical protein [Paenibacillus sp. LK1]PIH59299.1 hypothetical protein CS562_10370 [Paenibacillus sp. LK1]